MQIESNNLEQVQSRIAEIQSRISAISGEAAPAAKSQTVFSLPTAKPASTSGSSSTQYDDLLQEAASQYGVDAGLLKSVMLTESSGRSNAVSKAGAQGLMQLMPATSASLGVTDPFDPKQNIFGGARYLKGLIERTGTPELAVAAYNAGAGAVKKYGGIPPYPETQNYVANVMARWKGDAR